MSFANMNFKYLFDKNMILEIDSKCHINLETSNMFSFGQTDVSEFNRITNLKIKKQNITNSFINQLQTNLSYNINIQNKQTNRTIQLGQVHS